MRILVIDNHSLHTSDITVLLEGHDVSFSDYSQCNYITEKPDVIILSGSHEFPFYSEVYNKELELIRNTGIPIIGICLGCQLIAYAYECSFYREEKKIEGIQQIKYIPSQSHYKVYEGHKFCINELSEQIIGEAASEYGYEIIRHMHKPQRGVQFHPEVSQLKNDGALLFTTILSKIIS